MKEGIHIKIFGLCGLKSDKDIDTNYIDSHT